MRVWCRKNVKPTNDGSHLERLAGAETFNYRRASTKKGRALTTDHGSHLLTRTAVSLGHRRDNEVLQNWGKLGD